MTPAHQESSQLIPDSASDDLARRAAALSDQPGLRIGCDIVELAEIEESIDSFGERYLQRVFTAGERSECDGVDRLPRLAARFAAKEAVVKAFADTGMATPLHDVEVVTIAGVPEIRLHGSLARAAARQHWREVRVSLSHTRCYAIALVAVQVG